MGMLYGYDLPPATQRIMCTEWSRTQAVVFLEALRQTAKETAAFALLPTEEPVLDDALGLEPGTFKMYLESLVDTGALLQGVIPNIYVVSREWAKHPDFVRYPKVYTDLQ